MHNNEITIDVDTCQIELFTDADWKKGICPVEAPVKEKVAVPEEEKVEAPPKARKSSVAKKTIAKKSIIKKKITK